MTDRQTDRRTDGQRDGFAIAYSALSMLSRAKNDDDDDDDHTVFAAYQL